MAHYAEVSNGKVVNVIVIPNDQEQRVEKYLAELGLTGNYIQTSYNGKIRTRFAGIGDFYNDKKDRFEPPKNFDSWVWDEVNYCWKPPIEEPTDSIINQENGEIYDWDESSVSWVKAEA